MKHEIITLADIQIIGMAKEIAYPTHRIIIYLMKFVSLLFFSYLIWSNMRNLL